MRKNLIASLLIAPTLLFASCTPGPIEGDWFVCEDDACTVLDDEGVRFTADGRWAVLDAPGGELDPGEVYHLDMLWGSYTLEGSTLTLQIDGQLERRSAQISFDGDDLLVHSLKQGQDCIQVAPPSGGGAARPPTCEPVESKTIRMRRVGPAGDVPSDPPPEQDDWAFGSSTTPAPAPGN